MKIETVQIAPLVHLENPTSQDIISFLESGYGAVVAQDFISRKTKNYVCDNPNAVIDRKAEFNALVKGQVTIEQLIVEHPKLEEVFNYVALQRDRYTEMFGVPPMGLSILSQSFRTPYHVDLPPECKNGNPGVYVHLNFAAAGLQILSPKKAIHVTVWDSETVIKLDGSEITGFIKANMIHTHVLQPFESYYFTRRSGHCSGDGSSKVKARALMF